MGTALSVTPDGGPAAPGADRSIIVEAVGRTFGDLRAVDEVDLEVASGSILGLLGPNGAGESTLVCILITFLAPSAGDARMAGHASDAGRRRCGAPSAWLCRMWGWTS